MVLFSRISGATGSGKTLLLKALKARGEQILDLEDLAKHKGKNPQPRDCNMPGQVRLKQIDSHERSAMKFTPVMTLNDFDKNNDNY